MKSAFLTILLLCTFHLEGANLPIPISWSRLEDVKFVRKFNKEVSMHFLYPNFGISVRALEGKEVQIKGYMIPIDPENNLYVLSAQPMAMCFFCGGAGPESIIELEFKDKRLRFKTDEIKKVKGKLRLNADNIEHLNYILKEVVVYN